MAPKKRSQPKLDRAQLEQVACERIDAVTAEPLHPTKYVEIVSPDGTLRLFYNTATLIRIGLEKGSMMQPPHFREEMSPEILSRVEALEGRKIDVKCVSRTVHGEDEDWGFGGHGGGEIVHNHVYFEQIVDEFFRLSPAEVYVCPDCYQHLVATSALGKPVDPLDILSRVDDGGKLKQIVFRYARDFKAHMKEHHWADEESNENRLRDYLCTYFSDYNNKNKGKRSFYALTLHRYWWLDARYNVVRFNRIVEQTESAHRSSCPLMRQCAFPTFAKEQRENRSKVTKSIKSRMEPTVEIVDDDEEDEWVPRFAGSDEEEIEEDQHTTRRHSGKKPLRKKGPVAKRKRESDSSSTSSSESTSTSSDEASSTSSSSCSETHVKKDINYIKPHHKSDRLTYEERQVVQRELEKIRREEFRHFGLPTVRRPCTKLKDDEEDIPADIDWATYGEQSVAKDPEVHLTRSARKACNNPSDDGDDSLLFTQHPATLPGKLLLDDD